MPGKGTKAKLPGENNDANDGKSKKRRKHEFPSSSDSRPVHKTDAIAAGAGFAVARNLKDQRVVVKGTNNNSTRVVGNSNVDDNLGVDIRHDNPIDVDEDEQLGNLDIQNLINQFDDGIQVAVDAGDLEEFDARECELNITEEEEHIFPIPNDQQHCQGNGEVETTTNQVILTQATKDWMAQQRQLDDQRMRSMLNEMLNERFNNGNLVSSEESNNIDKTKQTPVTRKTKETMNVKSPSDTTIYAPAIARRNDVIMNMDVSGNNQIQGVAIGQGSNTENESQVICDISAFVGAAREALHNKGWKPVPLATQP